MGLRSATLYSISILAFIAAIFIFMTAQMNREMASMQSEQLSMPMFSTGPEVASLFLFLIAIVAFTGGAIVHELEGTGRR